MRRIVVCFLVVLLLSLPLTGCSEFTSPPNVDDVRSFFEANQEDILCVTAYLQDNYDGLSVYTMDGNGKVLVGADRRLIGSKEIQESVRRLYHAGCVKIGKTDVGGIDSVFFCLWRGSMSTQHIGVACTVDGEGTPKLQYQTDCVEIADGWYYYLEDYETYRANRGR